MYSLLLDTHGQNVIIVLYKDGKVIDTIDMISNNKHSVVLWPKIDEIFGNNNITVNDIKEVIVVNGPGSFTGVRIAVTVAKTMAYSLDIPIKSIDSLRILAVNVDGTSKVVAIPDKNGAFVGRFDDKNIELGDYLYYNKQEYLDLLDKENIFEEENIKVDYNLVYDYLKGIAPTNAHIVNPLYVKGITARNDK